MIYKKVIRKCWKRLNRQQKKQLKDILRDITDQITMEYSETIRIPKIHLCKQWMSYIIDETGKDMTIGIEITKRYS